MKASTLAAGALFVGALFTVGCYGASDPSDFVDPDVDAETQACSDAKPIPGDSDLVAITKDGQRVSYTSLTWRERRQLDYTFGIYEDHANSADGSCTYLDQGLGGWQCEGDHWMCYCIHHSSGPECHCEKDDC